MCYEDLVICKDLREEMIDDISKVINDISEDDIIEERLNIEDIVNTCITQSTICITALNIKLSEHNLKIFAIKDTLNTIFDNDLMNVLDEYFTNKGQFKVLKSNR